MAASHARITNTACARVNEAMGRAVRGRLLEDEEGKLLDKLMAHRGPYVLARRCPLARLVFSRAKKLAPSAAGERPSPLGLKLQAAADDSA